MASDKRLLCPNHPGRRVYLEHAGPDGDRVQCPECGETWPNYLKYPVQEVVDLNTGEIELKHVLTGEPLSPQD